MAVAAAILFAALWRAEGTPDEEPEPASESSVDQELSLARADMLAMLHLATAAEFLLTPPYPDRWKDEETANAEAALAADSGEWMLYSRRSLLAAGSYEDNSLVGRLDVLRRRTNDRHLSEGFFEVLGAPFPAPISVPGDPFSAGGEDYVLTIQHPTSFLLQSRGPDGDLEMAPLEILKYEKFALPPDTYYDPTNGTNSGGDIILAIVKQRDFWDEHFLQHFEEPFYEPQFDYSTIHYFQQRMDPEYVPVHDPEVGRNMEKTSTWFKERHPREDWEED